MEGKMEEMTKNPCSGWAEESPSQNYVNSSFRQHGTDSLENLLTCGNKKTDLSSEIHTTEEGTVSVLIYTYSWSHQSRGGFACDKEHEEEVILYSISMSLNYNFRIRASTLECEHFERLNCLIFSTEHSVYHQQPFEYIDMISGKKA
jgi:hypothetical protein